jgi:hypothetical protein
MVSMRTKIRPVSRRDFILSTCALALLGRVARADENIDLLAACEHVFKTVSMRVLDDLWDKHGEETHTGEDDTADLQKVFTLFAKETADRSEFLLTRNFISKPISSNGIDFILPFADPLGEGLPLPTLLRQRIERAPVLRLKTRAGTTTTAYTESRDIVSFPMAADRLQIEIIYDGSEQIVGSTFPSSTDQHSANAQIRITTGFVRRVMESSIYAYPVIHDSRTLLWPTLLLRQGPKDTILVEGAEGPVAISLLPLFCRTERAIYNFESDKREIVKVMERFYRVFSVFQVLRKGQKLPRSVDVEQLRHDIEVLEAISQLFFLTCNFILCHEIAHAVYLHRPTNDSGEALMHELQADQAATLHLFLIALTDCLDPEQSWTRYWRYSRIGQQDLGRRLGWFERLFGFGLATNIALGVIEPSSKIVQRQSEQRWLQNVHLWNECALAFSG